MTVKTNVDVTVIWFVRMSAYKNDRTFCTVVILQLRSDPVVVLQFFAAFVAEDRVGIEIGSAIRAFFDKRCPAFFAERGVLFVFGSANGTECFVGILYRVRNRADTGFYLLPRFVEYGRAFSHGITFDLSLETHCRQGCAYCDERESDEETPEPGRHFSAAERRR